MKTEYWWARRKADGKIEPIKIVQPPNHTKIAYAFGTDCMVNYGSHDTDEFELLEQIQNPYGDGN